MSAKKSNETIERDFKRIRKTKKLYKAVETSEK